MTGEFEFIENPEQLGLSEEDKHDLELGGLKMFEKIVTDYPKELPDIVVYPESTARPLAYLANEVLSAIAKERGIKKPTTVFFWTHFPDDKTFIREVLFKQEEYMDYETYLNSQNFIGQPDKDREKFVKARTTNKIRAQTILDIYSAEAEDKSHEPNIMIIDDQVGYCAVTARELAVWHLASQSLFIA